MADEATKSAWVEMSLDDDVRVLVEGLAKEYASGEESRSAAAGGGIVPHSTVLYFGDCTDEQLKKLMKVVGKLQVQDLRVTKADHAELQSIGNPNDPKDSYIAIHFDVGSETSEWIQRVRQKVYNGWLAAGLTPKGKSPAEQPWRPHISLLQYDTQEQRDARLKALDHPQIKQEVGSLDIRFRAPRMAVRDKATKELKFMDIN